MRVLPQVKEVKEALDRLDARVLHGAGQDIIKPKKTGNPVTDFLNWLDFVVFSFLDRLDTRFIFKKRAVRTENGRVRSRAERKLACFFKKHNIDYIYEPTLTLDNIKLHPDFYLSRYGVYVELWGLADTDEGYQKTMALKRRLYQKHRVPLISVYPRHLKDLEKSFPALFEEATGRQFSS